MLIHRYPLGGQFDSDEDQARYLKGREIGVQTGTIAATYADRLGLKLRCLLTSHELARMFADGKLAGVICDETQQGTFLSLDPRARVTELRAEPQQYAIAVSAINRGLVRHLNDGLRALPAGWVADAAQRSRDAYLARERSP